MKKSLFVLYGLALAAMAIAQNHSVGMKLLSTDITPIDIYRTFKLGRDLPMEFEYDSENRVTKITQGNNGYLIGDMSIEYGSNEIRVKLDDYYSSDEWEWISTLENDHIVKEVCYRDNELREIILFTYDSQDQIIHIERDCPEERDRNMSYDIEWSNGLPTMCYEHWANGKYEKVVSYTYTDIKDLSLVNAFVAPIAWIDNIDSWAMSLIYCHRYYGRMATLLPESMTSTYSIYKGQTSDRTSTHTFNYNLDSQGKVGSLCYDNEITVTFNWDNTVPIPDEFTIGDVNDDSTVDGSDVTALANYIICADSSPINETAADVNGDETVDIADLAALINLVVIANQ